MNSRRTTEADRRTHRDRDANDATIEEAHWRNHLRTGLIVPSLQCCTASKLALKASKKHWAFYCFQSVMSKRSPIKRSTSYRESNSQESSSSSDDEHPRPIQKAIRKRKVNKEGGIIGDGPTPASLLQPSACSEHALSGTFWRRFKNYCAYRWHLLLPAVLIVLLGISLGMYSFCWPRCTREEKLEKANSIQKIIFDIQRKFPAQHKDLWRSLYSALKTVAECDSLCPKVVLLLNQEDELSRATSSCLVKMVGNYSAPIFEAGQPLILKGDDFNCKNDCYDELRSKVQKHGTVIIQNLEKFPKESAAALHFFCDEHDSSAAKAAYILTMTIRNGEKEATRAAEKAFHTLWPEMKEEVKMALIARLTSLVGYVIPEQSLPCDQ